MEELRWTQLYLYTPKASQEFIDRVNHLANDKDNLTYVDLNKFDLIHPGQHTSIAKFLRDYSIPTGSYCLEVGSGYGGTSRYLAMEKGIRVYGIDYLENLVNASVHANKILMVGDQVEHYHGDILTCILPQETFDFAFAIGVFMHIESDLGILNIAKALKPGGLLFIEDYFLMKEHGEYTENDEFLLKERHMYGVKTWATVRESLEKYGFEVLSFDPWSLWSEEAWERAEKIIVAQREGTIQVSYEYFYQYVEISPQVSCDLTHYTPEELREKFPNLCSDYHGEDIVFRRPKITNIFRVVARKKTSN